MEKQFGALLAAIATVVAVWPLFNDETFDWPWGVAAVAALLLAWRAPQLLTPLARGWLWLGHLLGYVNTRVILALVFFVVITPVALLFRLLGRDALRLKVVKASSYWREQGRQWPPEGFKDQF
jgi:hypothetical protein